MKLNITPLLNGEVNVLPFEYSKTPEQNCYSDITFREPVAIKGKVTNRSGYMTLELSVSGEYETSCARCMTALHKELNAAIEKEVALKETLQNEDTDDYIVCTDSQLDLDEVLSELMYLELPSKLLCREDCKGLCPKCGKDLNYESCDCVIKEPDPRWAVLKNYFSENK